MHPGLQRAWLQTGGQPVQPIHALFRQSFDQVDHVIYLGAGCAKLFDAAGLQVGILQFQGIAQTTVDDHVAKTLQDALEGEPERKPDPAAGDTVIRKLDMSDAADREMVRLGTAVSGVSDRDDPPPIDLPDYDQAGNRLWSETPPPVRPEKDYRWLVGIAFMSALWVAGGVAFVAHRLGAF